MALLVQATLPTFGIRIYAVVFLVAGVAGRAGDPRRAAAAEAGTGARRASTVRSMASPRAAAWRPRGRGANPAVGRAPRTELERFIRSITFAAFGAGFGPYLSIYSISVLGLSPAFAILLSALASGASLVSATIVGGMLARGSASRTLRLSMLMRGGSMLFGLLAFPQNPVAGLVVCVVAVVASAGAAAGSLSSNERLMRLVPGPDLIDAQGRFVAGTALGVTAGQFSNAAILAVLPLGFPAFAILFTVSGVTRFITAARSTSRRPGRRARWPTGRRTSSGRRSSRGIEAPPSGRPPCGCSPSDARQGSGIRSPR